MSTSPWLTVGRIYTVLAIGVDDSGVKFRIIGDDGQTPGLHKAIQFDLVSGDIPASWVVSYVPEKLMELGPAAWAKAGFWEDYFDNDPAARTIFDTEVREIMEPIQDHHT